MDAFDEFLDRVLIEISNGVPEFPAQMGLFEVAGKSLAQHRFTDISNDAAASRQETLQALANRLEKFPRSEMTDSQLISADVLRFFFDFVHERDWIGLKGKDFLQHEYLLRPSVGLQSDLPLFLSDLHPMRHEQDASDYLKRLSLIASRLLEADELVRERQRDGILPPRFLIRDTIQEINAFIATQPRENIVYSAFADKTETMTGLVAASRSAMLGDIEREIHKRTYPAYMKLAATLSRQEKNASDEPGLWRLPDGDAYYDFLLQCATTTSLSADEIHELGRTETEKLEAEIVSTCRDLDIHCSDLQDCYRQLDQQKSHLPKDGSVARRTIVRSVELLIDDIRNKLPKLFHHLPESEIIVKPIPEFAESSRNQIYQPPSLDGSRAGLFEINVGQLLGSNDAHIELPTLVYHEIFPGHHLQMALAIESQELPLIRRIITFDAYIEGWAKYAETVPWTHGINIDPRWHVSRMRRELISTVNLVVDTGIHKKRWSVNKAMDYLQTHLGLDTTFSRYLVHRSAAVPAQMCSYKIGMLKMMQLRNRMSNAAGDAFDIRDFHDAVLRNGAVPLTLLDNLVQQDVDTRAH